MNPKILKNGAQSTISEAEIGHFDALARQWWDDNGEFKALHRINPVRLQYITDQLGRHFGRRTGAAKPLSGLSVRGHRNRRRPCADIEAYHPIPV